MSRQRTLEAAGKALTRATGRVVDAMGHGAEFGVIFEASLNEARKEIVEALELLAVARTLDAPVADERSSPS